MAKKKGLDRQALSALLLGSTAAATKRAATPPQWRKIVKTAHGRGYSVNSFLSDTPNALKERTPQSLKAQAVQTISAAYAPAEADLKSRDARTTALDDKRKRDNAAYNEWLDTQQRRLASDAASADQALADHQAGIQQHLNDSITQAKAESAASLAATPGNVSDPAQSNALNERAAAERARGGGLFAAGAERSAEQGHENAKQVALAGANNTAYMAAQDAKRVSDTFKSLSDVADARTKLKLSKAADSTKEVGRLLDQEISKANSNRDYNVLLDKLDVTKRGQDITKRGQDITAANNKATNKIARSNVRTNRENADTAKKAMDHLYNKQRHDAMLADKKFGLDRKKYGLAVAKQNWAQSHPSSAEKKAAWELSYEQKHGHKVPSGNKGAKGPADFTPTQIRAAQGQLRKVQTAIKAIGQGVTEDDLTNPVGQFKYDSLIAQAALALRKHPGGVSPAFDKKFFAAYGFHLKTRGK